MRFFLLVSLLVGSVLTSACGDDDYGVDLARPDLSGVVNGADLAGLDLSETVNDLGPTDL